MVEFLIERAAILVYMRSIAILKVNGDKIKKKYAIIPKTFCFPFTESHIINTMITVSTCLFQFHCALFSSNYIEKCLTRYPNFLAST